MQDFLPRTGTIIDSLNDFPARFRFLFIHLKVHKALKALIHSHPQGSSISFSPEEGFEDLSKFDWSRVRVRMVMSIPGTFTGFDEMTNFGQCRLGAILTEEGWFPDKGERVVTEYQVGQ